MAASRAIRRSLPALRTIQRPVAHDQQAMAMRSGRKSNRHQPYKIRLNSRIVALRKRAGTIA